MNFFRFVIGIRRVQSWARGNEIERMSGGRIKLDLDSILQGYGFLTMLPSGDLLNFGNSGNNN